MPRARYLAAGLHRLDQYLLSVFPAEASKDDIIAFVDRLKVFKLGYSWGGVTRLVMPQLHLHRDRRGYGHRLVRFNIGLEDTEDLIADIEAAFTA